MKRRSFLAGTAAATAGALAAPAIAQGLTQWKMLTLWPRGFPGLGTSSARLAAAVNTMSDGRLTIKIYSAGELVPAYETFDAVRGGTAECAHEAPYIWTGKHPAMAFFCSVPGGLAPQEHNAWIYHGGGQALWDELYGAFGLRSFLAGNSSANMGGWYRKPIDSVDDFRGLKMRIPGLGAEVLTRLGATTVNLSGGEIVPALQTGTIDAAEWIAPYADLAFGFHKVADYYYGPGVHEPGPAAAFTVNLAAYQALPPDLQAILRQAAAAEVGQMHAEMLAGNAVALETLIARHGVDVRHFSDDIIRRLHQVSADVVADVAQEDDLARRIGANWSSFRKKAMAFAPYSGHGYIVGRALATS